MVSLLKTTLQIMDPKMDSGFLLEGETLEDDYDVSQELTPEQVLGIMDQLLCYEVCSAHSLRITIVQSRVPVSHAWPLAQGWVLN